MKTKPKTISLKVVLKAIDDEPEYPGEMYSDVWESIKNNKKAMQEALRLTVRLTKEGIKNRLLNT